jgi:hypothetical protein
MFGFASTSNSDVDLHTVTCRGYCVTYRRVLDWMIWMIGFIPPFTFTNRDNKQYSAIADLRTLQFTVTHALGFSVFASRILATDLSQSHCNFKSHMKSSFHLLIPFLPIFYGFQFRRHDSIQFLCSRAHIPAGWRLETRLSTFDSTTVLFCPVLNTSL